MAAVNHFEVLTRSTESAIALKEYLAGRGLQDTLAVIGDAELRTVRKAFEDLESASEEKRTAIEKALARLQAVHGRYQKIHQSATQGWRKDLCMEAMTKDIFVCCLMALCHAYLKDGRAAIERALTEAKVAYESSIYLTDHNDRGQRSSTAQIDTAIGSFLGRIDRADLSDRSTARSWQDRGARVTDGLLEAGTFVYNFINPFYYKHLGNIRNGKIERIGYGDLTKLETNLIELNSEG